MTDDWDVGVRCHVLKGVALGASIAVVSALQHITPPASFTLHAIYLRTYYVPIIFGAIWYRRAGGVVTALVCVAACSLTVAASPWAAYPSAIGEYAEFAVFVLIGAVVGRIAGRERTNAEDEEGGAPDPAAAGRVQAVDRVDRRFHTIGAGRSTPVAQASADQPHGSPDRAFGSIAAGLAQEIERPLIGLRNAVEVAFAPSAPVSSERDVSVMARRELRRLETLVTRLMAYARPCRPDLRQASLAEVLHRMRSRLAHHAARRGVSIETRGDRELPPLVIDARQIEQVLFNIALNAVQASARGDRVVVRVARGQRSQVIEVLDDGPGIAREYRDRVFEPFFTTKECGVGLGLAIARRIIDAHCGTIELKRGGRGGTLVRIELPEDENGPGSTTAGAVHGLRLKL